MLFLDFSLTFCCSPLKWKYHKNRDCSFLCTVSDKTYTFSRGSNNYFPTVLRSTLKWDVCGCNECWCSLTECQVDKKRHSVLLYLLIQTHSHHQTDAEEWTPAAFNGDVRLVFFILVSLKELRIAFSTSVMVFLHWNNCIWALWTQCQAPPHTHTVFWTDQLALCSLHCSQHFLRLRISQQNVVWMPRDSKYTIKYSLKCTKWAWEKSASQSPASAPVWHMVSYFIKHEVEISPHMFHSHSDLFCSSFTQRFPLFQWEIFIL